MKYVIYSYIKINIYICLYIYIHIHIEFRGFYLEEKKGRIIRTTRIDESY
jgi:hypothetical protein